MNYEACESFIQFCDNMMIAEEGIFKKKPKKQKSYPYVSINDCIECSTLDEAIDEMEDNTPLIKLVGPRAMGIVTTIKDSRKAWFIDNYRSIDLLADVYRVVKISNEFYLMHMDFKIKEYNSLKGKTIFDPHK